DHDWRTPATVAAAYECLRAVVDQGGAPREGVAAVAWPFVAVPSGWPASVAEEQRLRLIEVGVRAGLPAGHLTAQLAGRLAAMPVTGRMTAFDLTAAELILSTLAYAGTP